ncbi:hypothetical protein [Acidovorax sp.]|uniref:hypothetical protein n=1 Tax=Acidovorax sp. TaxID=1872122 RepID=UPI00391F21E2
MNRKSDKRGHEPDGYEKWESLKISTLVEDAQKRTGKQFVNLEDYLAMKLRHPLYRDEALPLNATGVLRLLGIEDTSKILRTRAHNWLKKNGFERYEAAYNFRVALVDKARSGYIII